MGRVEDLEKAVEGLSSEDLREFRRWFFEFDAELWDRQLERDVADGKLDEIIDEALAKNQAARALPQPAHREVLMIRSRRSSP